MAVLRGRYAPSPTGHLHLGNARTALLAWLQVRARGGRFVMRVEDVDPGRSRRAIESEQLEDLRWLGLDWDEGPDVGGPHGPYRQSERSDHYAAALARLSTFACSCSRRDLRDATLAPHGHEPIYPGTCRDGPQKPDRPLSIRWHTPDQTVAFDDLVQGRVVEDVAAAAGSFVLRRGDGAFAYQLAVVVDDAAMGITHVLRGADLLASTARQILLQRALALPTPAYAHVPLLLGLEGEKLSKRGHAPALAELRAAGVDPRTVVAFLAHSIGLGSAAAAVSPHELLADFDAAALPRADTAVEPPEFLLQGAR